MNINISSLHFKTDQKLEAFINEKVEKLAKMHDGIIGAEVTLKLENTDKPENKSAEIRIKVRGNDVMAEKTAKTFEEATDTAVEALKKQLINVLRVRNLGIKKVKIIRYSTHDHIAFRNLISGPMDPLVAQEQFCFMQRKRF